jgi:calcium permeable stress-gated cation channel
MPFQLPDTYVLKHNSIDGYFLLRYLRIAVIICFLGCCMIWPILFPVNATGGAGQKQLDILSFTNIKKTRKHRYYGECTKSATIGQDLHR